MPLELREALESAVTQAETSAAAETPAPAAESLPASESAPVEPAQGDKPAAETPAAKPEPASDVADKPAAEKKEAQPAGEKKPEDKSEEGMTEAQKREHRVDRPPQSWKKEAKGEWANLPLSVRQEAVRLDREVQRVLSESARERQIAQQFSQTITPYLARIDANGVSPMEAAQHLFRADYTLATAPMPQRAQFMADLIKQYGIDIRALDEALAGAAPQQSAQQSPDISALVQQQVQQMVAPLLQQQQAQQQRIQKEAVQSVEDMEMNPDFPFFDEVREEMADLIEVGLRRGVVIPLEEAYSRAVRANPSTWQQLEGQSNMQSAQQKHEQAMRAKNAAASVSGAPAHGGSSQPVGDGSLRGAIEAAFSANRV